MCWSFMEIWYLKWPKQLLCESKEISLNSLWPWPSHFISRGSLSSHCKEELWYLPHMPEWCRQRPSIETNHERIIYKFQVLFTLPRGPLLSHNDIAMWLTSFSSCGAHKQRRICIQLTNPESTQQKTFVCHNINIFQCKVSSFPRQKCPPWQPRQQELPALNSHSLLVMCMATHFPLTYCSEGVGIPSVTVTASHCRSM